MNLNTHLELFLLEGTITELPTPSHNGTIIINGLEVEVFEEMSLMANEVFNTGDTVYFFIIPTQYIISSVNGFGKFTAINTSLQRRHVIINGFVSNRPCTNGTTIPAVPTGNLVKSGEEYDNYTLNEYNQLVITRAPFEVPPFTTIIEKETLNIIDAPYNPLLPMFQREFDEIHTDTWQ